MFLISEEDVNKNPLNIYISQYHRLL